MLTVHSSSPRDDGAVTPRSVRLHRLLISPQLRAFLAAAERRSFSAGAKALHLSESALKQRIHQLESTMGTKLTIPGRRPLRLTPAGGRFLLFAASLRDQCEKLECWLAQHANEAEEGASAGPVPRAAIDPSATIALLEQASQLLGEALAHAHGEYGGDGATPRLKTS